MEIILEHNLGENICVCDECEIPSDFGIETNREENHLGMYIVYKHGFMYNFKCISEEFGYEDVFLCDECSLNT